MRSNSKYFTFFSVILSVILTTTVGTFQGSAQPQATQSRQTSTSQRVMVADRPEITESPYSLVKGHFQIESSLISYLRIGPGLSDIAIGELSVTYGITNSLDVQSYVNAYRGRGARSDAVFFDGGGFRTKLNIVGNDSGNVAAAFVPFVFIPEGSSRATFIAGAAFPVAMKTGELGIGGMVMFSFVNYAGYGEEDLNFTISGIVSRRFFQRMKLYMEGVASFSQTQDTDPILTVAGGASIALTSDLQLDASGLSSGGNNDQSTTGITLGISVRL